MYVVIALVLQWRGAVFPGSCSHWSECYSYLSPDCSGSTGSHHIYFHRCHQPEGKGMLSLYMRTTLEYCVGAGSLVAFILFS